MTPHEFIAKWRNGGDERRDAQPFFEDLCRLVGHPTPKEADPEHSWFTYEYGATKTSGGDGWADVWKKGFFGWEAKGTHKSLERAYEQLKMYADALQNPPLLVVSDLHTIIVHTNFTNTVKREIKFTVEQLDDYETRQVLEAVFKHPETLRPGTTRAGLTQEAAQKFTALAKALRDRGHDAHQVAHFLNRLLFCMFAEDIGLLPAKLFTDLVENAQNDPASFEQWSGELFRAMKSGGTVAFKRIDWFNGGLFEDDATLRLEPDDLKTLFAACRLDWSEIEPSIFGTLFERGLDPSKRSQLGAHYTDPETIIKIIRPVIVEPWLREWESEKAALAPLLAKAKKSISKLAQDRFARFLVRLRAFRVLDPACGSGNFLYMALLALKDIEKRVLIEGEGLGLGRQFPSVGPASVKGIELNEYAADLARITVWIGEIQWMVQNGYGANKNPILQPLDQIENRDALLNPDGSEAVWPLADVAIGNPPFIGDKKIVGELGAPYAETLRRTYAGRVPGGADFVCYWFEKANDAIRAGTMQQAGLVATNSIRGGKNREVLKHIAEAGRIFDAWSDEEWINEGAAVRVSLISFGRPFPASEPRLNGQLVHEIHPDLTAPAERGGADLTRAKKLAQNSRVCFYATVKAGSFDIDGETARQWLAQPNPNGRPNSDVVKPFFNGLDVVRRNADRWVVDFGVDAAQATAALYQEPYEYVLRVVKPEREKTRREKYRNNWWLFAEPIPGMRAALKGKERYIATVAVSKHRIWSWIQSAVLADHALMVVARDDDTAFGILHSRLHEVWALRMGTSLEDRPRYTPTSCFETFPFPEGLTPDIAAADYADDRRVQRIADASRALVEARDRWLNPPEWTERVSEVVAGYPDRILARPGHGAELKKRTLTSLYNTRPVWLDNLHADLDAAVAAAYGWSWPMADNEILIRLFQLNQERSATAP